MESSSRECNSNISNSSTVTTSVIDYSLVTNNDKTVDFLICEKENDASDTEIRVGTMRPFPKSSWGWGGGDLRPFA